MSTQSKQSDEVGKDYPTGKETFNAYKGDKEGILEDHRWEGVGDSSHVGVITKKEEQPK